MSQPSVREVQTAILEELAKIGGRAYWENVSQAVATNLHVSSGVLIKKTPKGKNYWNYRRMKPARTELSKQGYITVGGGYWQITPKGISHLSSKPQATITGQQLVERAGGEDSLNRLLDLVDRYISGEIMESELAREMRRLVHNKQFAQQK